MYGTCTERVSWSTMIETFGQMTLVLGGFGFILTLKNGPTRRANPPGSTATLLKFVRSLLRSLPALISMTTTCLRRSPKVEMGFGNCASHFNRRLASLVAFFALASSLPYHLPIDLIWRLLALGPSSRWSKVDGNQCFQISPRSLWHAPIC